MFVDVFYALRKRHILVHTSGFRNFSLRHSGKFVIKRSIKLPRTHLKYVATLTVRETLISDKAAELYSKDDRAMRPIYGCPEKFRESSLRTRLLILKFVTGFCSDRY